MPEMSLLLLYARPYATQVMNRCRAIRQTRTVDHGQVNFFRDCKGLSGGALNSPSLFCFRPNTVATRAALVVVGSIELLTVFPSGKSFVLI